MLSVPSDAQYIYFPFKECRPLTETKHSCSHKHGLGKTKEGIEELRLFFHNRIDRTVPGNKCRIFLFVPIN